MTKIDQLTYLLQMHLQNMKKTESGYNFRCPICGDSKKNISKRRCWALTKKDPNDVLVYCHNCGYSSKFKTFLRNVNNTLFLEYQKHERQEKLNDARKGTLFSKPKSNVEINIDIPIQYQFKLNSKYFKPARNYKKAIEFCKKRKILDKINQLYYCIHPDNACSGMLIFPCLMPDGETLYAFTARHTEFKKFHTHSKNESFKIFNFFQVNLKEEVFIFESIIDSYTVTNSVAALGADISKSILDKIEQPIFVFDNDFTGKIKTEKYLNQGYRCFIPPDDFHYKDFNSALCDGMTKEQLNKILKSNIYSGIIGISKIKFKLMGKR